MGFFLLMGCGSLPSRYIQQAEPGVTLTSLTESPEAYQGKTVILGGVVIDHKQRGTAAVAASEKSSAGQGLSAAPSDRHRAGGRTLLGGGVECLGIASEMESMGAGDRGRESHESKEAEASVGPIH